MEPPKRFERPFYRAESRGFWILGTLEEEVGVLATTYMYKTYTVLSRAKFCREFLRRILPLPRARYIPQPFRQNFALESIYIQRPINLLEGFTYNHTCEQGTTRHIMRSSKFNQFCVGFSPSFDLLTIRVLRRQNCLNLLL